MDDLVEEEEIPAIYGKSENGFHIAKSLFASADE